MPSLEYTLPHWLYLVGLVAFPAIAMVLARRAKPELKLYSSALGYLILVTGGILGLHRFYVRSMWGLVFIPLFVFVLVSNNFERQARSVQSDAINIERVAERTIERERPRIEAAQKAIPELEKSFEEAEEGSFSKRSIEKRLERARDQVETGLERLATAEKEFEAAKPIAAEATEKRTFWSHSARNTFYLILALLALDALLLPRLVKRANDRLRSMPVEKPEPAEAAIDKTVEEEVRHDRDYAENWIDRMSLFAGEFVSYWAVIAVFVYYFEVIARYVFNSPTNWAHEAMYLMFGMQYLIAGSYAMLTEAHVKVDIFYAPLTRPKKAIADLLTSVFFFIFAGTLFYTSYTFAMDAIAVPTGNGVISDWARGEYGFGTMVSEFSLKEFTDPSIRWGEISFNEWEVPLWPMKWMMVVGGLLLVLQGVSKIAKDIRAIARGA
jgi:TRAP-type mannitol/chloroaromatic compound transport system permease small subunit